MLYRFGAAWSFGINAASFAAAIASLLMIRTRTAKSMEAARINQHHHRMGAGLSYLRSRGDLRVMILVILTAGLLAAPMMKLLPALASEMLDGGEKAFASMLTAFGLGAMTGAVLMAGRSSRGLTPWRSIPVLVLMGATQLLTGFVTSLVAAWLLCAVMGVLFINVMVRLKTAFLTTTPDVLRGRMTGLHQLAFRSSEPIGAVATGILAQRVGVAWTLRGFGAGLIVVGLAVMMSTRRTAWQTAPAS